MSTEHNYPTSNSNAALILLCFSLTMAGLAVLLYIQMGNREIGSVNQTYLRASNCFTAVPAANRTPDYITECYDKAEASTKKTVERYGDAK